MTVVCTTLSPILSTLGVSTTLKEVDEPPAPDVVVVVVVLVVVVAF